LLLTHINEISFSFLSFLSISHFSIRSIGEMEEQKQHLLLIQNAITSKDLKESHKLWATLRESYAGGKTHTALKHSTPTDLSTQNNEFIPVSVEETEQPTIEKAVDTSEMNLMQTYILRQTKELNEYTQRKPKDINGFVIYLLILIFFLYTFSLFFSHLNLHTSPFFTP
jgi:hypothetical protein